MIDRTCDNENPKEPVIYVKPVLTYEQIVEIIDDRIAIIEKAAKEKGEKKDEKKKK